MSRIVLDTHPTVRAVALGSRDFLRGLCRKAVRHAQHVTQTVRSGNDSINVLGVAKIHIAAPGEDVPEEIVHSPSAPAHD